MNRGNGVVQFGKKEIRVLMRRGRTLLAVGGVLLAVFSAPFAFAQDDTTDRFEDRNGDGEVRFLAFGDSITSGVGDGTPSDTFVEEAPILSGTLGYPGRLENALGLFVDNRGVPGEILTTQGIFRFSDELTRTAPDYVLILEGANDAIFRKSPTDYRAKLQAMVNIARARGIEPVLLTLTPTCCDRSGPTPFREAYSREVRDVAATNEVLFVDLELAFEQQCPSLSSCSLLNRPEGLHPNTSGYDFMAGVVTEILAAESEPSEGEDGDDDGE
ncbi:SGNH/GDSL hydrolase family protein [bacterium]|nr:SGNH/GDSL hydrolase family protein [bacterium]